MPVPIRTTVSPKPVFWLTVLPSGSEGVHSSGARVSTARRAVLLGAQACVAAFGQNKGPTKYKWVEELFDYKRELGVSVQTIMGLKKTQFNSADFGAVVVSTYAAAHT